ncbi:hypothetical protein A0H81_10033 [Grifola frondosa]|uniref:Uncharacterized protein n=1 Tax=Grifola frondosa TaxID=5627 RepID=A0A1C7M1W9_GRIFR|nr:hypothetical protein A0H81_10033 [Grifola frondosa]
MRREGRLSWSRDVDDWRLADTHDRYNRSGKDDFRRGGREDYDTHDSRKGESWSNRNDSDVRYDGWPEGRDQGYRSSSYQDSSSWTPSKRYESRGSELTSWPSEESRSGQHDRGRSRFGPSDGWGIDDHRDNNTQEWRRDNGWQSKRVDNLIFWRKSPLDHGLMIRRRSLSGRTVHGALGFVAA